MNIHLTGFKASTEIKSSRSFEVSASQIKEAIQSTCDIIPHDKTVPTYWSMVKYKDGGQHNNQSVDALTGIILEYDLRGANDLVAALRDIPWHYLVVETERKGGQFLSLFFPLTFKADVSQYMRIAGVLVYQLGVYGLSKGSGTPTFLVKLVGGQTVGEHEGPVIGMNFIKETQDIGPGSKTALDDFQGPKPVSVVQRYETKQDGPCELLSDGSSRKAELVSKEKAIASQLRILADLFDAD